METEYTVILEEDEEGGFSVHVPSLPGCMSEGDTIEEALENVRKAIQLYLETLKEDRRPVPTKEMLVVVSRVQVPSRLSPEELAQLLR